LNHIIKRLYIGAELATVINKAIDNNEKYSVEKDSSGLYDENNENSVRIDIYIADNQTTYSTEKIYKVGIEQFVSNFNTEQFKCTQIKYHEKSKRVKYLLFEQIS